MSGEDPDRFKRPRPKVKLETIRCIGTRYGDTEHVFLSTDRINDRFCAACRSRNASAETRSSEAEHLA